MSAPRRPVGRRRARWPGGRMSLARLEIRRDHRQTDHQSDSRRTVLRGRDPRRRYLRRFQLTIDLAAIGCSMLELISLSGTVRKIPVTKFAIFRLFRV